ncbi:Jag family protein [Tsukamurella soli]|uniref:R3H domain-containing protein n=1 Tax=Tsukamurella soli TaxID=644556 RepID=A0ABP8J2M4_9ACTN
MSVDPIEATVDEAEKPAPAAVDDAAAGDGVDEAVVSEVVSSEVGGSDTTAVADGVDAEDEDDDEDDELVEEGEIAADYLEQLLDILDFDGDIDLDVEGDRAIVAIDGGEDLAKLVGRRGEVLDALQELTRLSVQQSTGNRSRLMLDIANWRAGRRDRLSSLGAEVAARVLQTGERETLKPMTPFERKIVHDAVTKIAGVHSESEGVEPNRRVVVIKDA